MKENHKTIALMAVCAAVPIIIAIVVGLTLIARDAGGSDVASDGQDQKVEDRSQLEKLATVCAPESDPEVIRTGDEGRSLTVSGGSATATTPASLCVLAAIDTPDSVMSKVEGTTAMQGRQSESWDGWEVSWTYHPDDGVEVVVEEQ